MLRRLNYTNRARIRRSDVRIAVDSSNGLAFSADLSALREYDLPMDSLVFVEAYRQTNWMRFPFGRVGALESPADRRLRQFESPEGILFRVKVTPAGDVHTLLAEADRIPLVLSEVDDGMRESLLPVRSAVLDGELYRLDLSGLQPVLEISKVAGLHSEIARSPAFVALVYPAVLREILVRITLVDGHFDSDSLDDWQSRWLRFVAQIPGGRLPPKATAGESEIVDWINDAVEAFARRIRALERFSEFWKEGM